MKAKFPISRLILLITFFLPLSSGIKAQEYIWQPVNGPDGGMALAIATTVEGTLFVSTLGGGIYRSFDNGQSWSLLTNGLASLEGLAIDIPFLEFYYLGVIDMLVGEEGNIYAATAGFGVYRSTDNGNSWSPINNGLESLSISSLAMNDSGDLFLGNSWPGGVYRSMDKGENWEPFGLADTAVLSLAMLQDGYLLAGTKRYSILKSSSVEADWRSFSHNGNDRRSISKIESIEGYVFAVASDTMFIGFTDEGTTFGYPWRFSEGILGLAALEQSKILISSGKGLYVFADEGSMWRPSLLAFEGSPVGLISTEGNELIAGVGHGGLYFSSNNGITWENRSQGMNATLMSRLFVEEGATMILSTEETLYQSKDRGENWLAIAQLNSPVTSLLRDTEGHFFAGTARHGIFRSNDNGLIWEPINTGLSDLGINSLGINARGDLFAATDGGIFRLSNNGENWDLLNRFYPFGVSDLAIDSEGQIFAMSFDGFFRSNDNGDTWMVTSLLYPYLRGGIYINDQDHIFVFFDGLYQSTDNGETWELLGFDDMIISSVAFSESGNVFVTTFGTYDYGEGEYLYDTGVFVSKDNGKNWAAIDHDFRSTIITGLAVSSGEKLYAVTANNGMFYLDLSTAAPEEPSLHTTGFFLEQNYPNPFRYQTTISFMLSERSKVNLQITDSQGKKVTTLINDWLRPGSHQVNYSPERKTSGLYFYTLEVNGKMQTRRMILD